MKIGVYFCNCGTNISDKIDPEKIREEVRGIPGVEYFKTCDYLCSEEGKSFLEEDLKRERPERVVITACSPRDYEKTFRECVAKSAINPYLMQMVNLREQVAWVTADPGQAAQKATSYIRGAAARVSRHAPLEEKEIEVRPDVLVIGAGPAGLKAALAIAGAGRRVVLVEKSPMLGGMPVRFEELFPNLECGPCLLEPVLAEVLQEKRIEILTLSEVADIAGYCGNFLVKVRQSPRFIDLARCIGCGECVNACPESAPSPFNCGLNEKKAIAFAQTGALPNAPFIDSDVCRRGKGEDCQLCKAACLVDGAVLYDQQEKILDRNVGAIVLAVGSSLYDCSVFPGLAYGKSANVYTSMEFERLLAATGPTGGKILRRDGRPPETVAILHCVGSLDHRHRGYCSGVCCQYAFKFNQMIHHKLPEASVFHLHRELVTPGKEEFALFTRAEANPRATFLRYANLENVRISEREGTSEIRFQDASGHNQTILADMVVLCPAVVPAPASQRLAAQLQTPLDRFGFFEELHGRADAAQTKIKGIYLAGTCQGPKDIQASINQGMASAGYVLSQLPAGKTLTVEPITANVNEAVCSGCRICVKVCPYKAIGFDEEKEISAVNPLLCHGCGTCVAACPSGAMEGNHFTQEQIFAEIEGVLQ